MTRVGDFYEVKPLRRRRRTRLRSVPRRKDVTEPSNRPASAAYEGKASDKIPNHMLQKGIGSNLEAQQRSVAMHGAVEHFPHRMTRLAARRSEARKVILTDKDARRLLHRVRVQTVWKCRDAIPQERMYRLAIG